MIIIITGPTHVGKTYLSQKLLEKYNYPYLSLDLLKMGLIRSHYTSLTPNDDYKMTDYLWPIVKEIIKTAIENNQNLIIEGCYIPFDYKEYFSEEYNNHIEYICIAFTDNYINNNYSIIKNKASIIEDRGGDLWCTKEIVLRDNKYYIDGCIKNKLNIYVIDSEYEKVIEQILNTEYINILFNKT